jgi:hypothetical protein
MLRATLLETLYPESVCGARNLRLPGKPQNRGTFWLLTATFWLLTYVAPGKTLHQACFAELEIFNALHKHGQLLLRQDCVATIPGQIGDALAVALKADLTVKDAIRGRPNEMSPRSHFHGADNATGSIWFLRNARSSMDGKIMRGSEA